MAKRIAPWSKSPQTYPTASGKVQAQTDCNASSAKTVGKLKEHTGKPTGDNRPAVRFTLEEANHAKWTTEQVVGNQVD